MGGAQLSRFSDRRIASDAVVVVFSPYYPPAYRAGGPVKSISLLVRSAPAPFSVRVVSRNWDLGDTSSLRSAADTWVDTGSETLWVRNRGPLRYVRSLVAAAETRPVLVYVNSLFDPSMALLPALGWWVWLRRSSVLIIAPRGQLAPTALSKSKVRKRPVVWLWRRIARSGRAVVHAATEAEGEDIRRALGQVTVVVRPNEVGALAPAAKGPDPAEPLRAVFVGRIVPIKGLADLLVALRDLGRPLRLDVVGPEEDSRYLQLCREAASRLPSTVEVRFLGSVASDDVTTLVAGYDVMLNPTRGESFGQVIGESLSVGTPVLVPDVTPWTPWIDAAGGGKVVRSGEWASAVDLLPDAGSEEWGRLRRDARKAYERWWSDADRRPHVFELVRLLWA